MIPYRLAPAGEPIRLKADSLWREWLVNRCAPFGVGLYGSGTSALGAALCMARRSTGRRRVLLPGYACPALVSAALHAEMEVVPVDFVPERPWLDLTDLDRCLDERVAAVVGTDLLGLGERWPELADRCRANGSLLIQDSAQHFPGPGEPAEWPGDFVVLSFGRGKPVSLLGGGACLYRGVNAPPEGRYDEARLRPLLETVAYNTLIRPWLYWVPAVLPGLGLGETRYRPFRERPVNRWRLERLPANADRHPSGTAEAVAGVISSTAFGDLAMLCDVTPGRLLRYPLLAPTRAVRDHLAGMLGRWGGSALYGDALPWIREVPAAVRRRALPNARDFGARLLTLPIHGGLGTVALRNIARCLHTAGEVRDETHRLERREQS